MTQVRGKFFRPDGVTAVRRTVVLTLIDALGNPLRGFQSAADITVVSPLRVDLDSTGAYLADLVPNSAINPAGTRWRRELHGASIIQPVRDDLIVPASGGPFWEEDILAETLAPLPDPDPSNILDEAEITTATSALTVGPFTLTPVPLLVATVPNVPYRTRVRVRGPIINTPSRTVNTVGTTNGSPNITGPADAFTAEDEGRTIAGTGIPASTKIVAVLSETTAVISNNATATGSITATITGGISVCGLCTAVSPGNAIGQQKDVGWVQLVRTAAVAMSVSEVDVAPNTPGDWVAAAYSLDPGTMVVDASATQKARIEVVRSPALASP